MSKENSLITNVADIFSAPSAGQIVMAEAREEHKIEKKNKLKYHEIGFKKHNKTFPDGRVYGGYDSNGLYYAVTVSPYFNEFDTQVEKGIQPVVLALKEKGFLTCSSCYGHPMRAMVVTCFPSIETREEFANIIRNSGIPTIHINYIDSIVNVGIEEDRYGDINFTQTIEFDRTSKEHLDREVESFNRLFFRSFEKYYFLDIWLVGDHKWYRNPIKRWNTNKYLNKKDYLINSLAELILSDQVPQQKY